MNFSLKKGMSDPFKQQSSYKCLQNQTKILKLKGQCRDHNTNAVENNCISKYRKKSISDHSQFFDNFSTNVNSNIQFSDNPKKGLSKQSSNNSLTFCKDKSMNAQTLRQQFSKINKQNVSPQATIVVNTDNRKKMSSKGLNLTKKSKQNSQNKYNSSRLDHSSTDNLLYFESTKRDNKVNSKRQNYSKQNKTILNLGDISISTMAKNYIEGRFTDKFYSHRSSKSNVCSSKQQVQQQPSFKVKDKQGQQYQQFISLRNSPKKQKSNKIIQEQKHSILLKKKSESVKKSQDKSKDYQSYRQFNQCQSKQEYILEKNLYKYNLQNSYSEKESRQKIEQKKAQTQRHKKIASILQSSKCNYYYQYRDIEDNCKIKYQCVREKSNIPNSPRQRKPFKQQKIKANNFVQPLQGIQSARVNSNKQSTLQRYNQNSFIYERVVGKGGFGKVWKVQCKRTKKIYALKQMSKALIISKKSVPSVMNQQKLLSSLKHDFIVNMCQSFQTRQNLFLVMDFLSGGDLRHHLGVKRYFNEEQTKFIIVCIMLGLKYLHQNQVIHRDIKPQNIVLDQNGYARITDLGVARKFRTNNSADTSGTPGYMAPEVLCRQNHAYTADYFAVGVIAYELMLRKRPYYGKSRKQIRDEVLSRQVQIKKQQIPDSWSLQGADFINRMIQRKPSNRLGYKSISEIFNHPWIKKFPYQLICQKKLKAPYLPQKSFSDKQANYTSSQDTQIKQLMLENEIMLRKKQVQSLFQGYQND